MAVGIIKKFGAIGSNGLSFLTFSVLPFCHLIPLAKVGILAPIVIYLKKVIVSVLLIIVRSFWAMLSFLRDS